MKRIISFALVAIMMLTLTVTAFAVKDPIISPHNPDTEYSIKLYTTKGGTAIYRINDDGTITFIATPYKGHTFTKWIIDGDYIIVSGEITDREFTVKPKTDLKVIASFDNNTEPVINPWEEEDSPKTGNFIAPVVAVAVVALLGCAYSFKRSHNA